MLSLVAMLMLSAPSSSDLATANPDAPALELGWRDGIRAKGGGRIRFIGEGEDSRGGFFDFQGFIELHNRPGYFGPIPYECWRGRFALEGGARFLFEGPTPWGLKVAAGVEHESDHQTSPNLESTLPVFGFVNLNSLALHAGLRHGRVAPTHVDLTARLHLVTCTRDPIYCGKGGGTYGDRAFEGELSLTQELSLWGSLEKWNLFASAWGQVSAASALVFPARRVSVRVGVIRHRATDAIALFFQALAGTDLGYYRQRETVQLGAGLAWTPD